MTRWLGPGPMAVLTAVDAARPFGAGLEILDGDSNVVQPTCCIRSGTNAVAKEGLDAAPNVFADAEADVSSVGPCERQ